MVYDLQSHRQHVILSPFTCLDWERSENVVGIRLKEIFPVGRLQPRDFMEARRGIENYFSDIKNGCVTYREYAFYESKVTEVEESSVHKEVTFDKEVTDITDPEFAVTAAQMCGGR